MPPLGCPRLEGLEWSKWMRFNLNDKEYLLAADTLVIHHMIKMTFTINPLKELIKSMADNFVERSDAGQTTCDQEILERHWSKNMIWFGPCGIGAPYTLPRYQRQHQLPFR